MTKKDFISATIYWLKEGENSIGEVYPDMGGDRKKDVQVVTKKILEILQGMPAGEFRNMEELNYDY